jgi:hypothetical protein
LRVLVSAPLALVYFFIAGFIGGLAMLDIGLGAPGLAPLLLAGFIIGLADELLAGLLDELDDDDGFAFFFGRRSPSESEPERSSASLPPF